MTTFASFLDINGKDYAEDRTAAGFIKPLSCESDVTKLHHDVCTLTNDHIEAMHTEIVEKQRAQKKKMIGLDGGATSAFLTVHGYLNEKKQMDLLIGSSNLADASNYLFILKPRGKHRVVRLNAELHRPTDREEMKRIKAAGGDICEKEERLNGVLAVAAAYGGYWLDEISNLTHVIRRQVSPSIFQLRRLLKSYGVRRPEKLDGLLLVNCCDGIVDIAPNGYESTKRRPTRLRRLGDELFLENFIYWFEETYGMKLHHASSDQIARSLVGFSKGRGSKDNLAVNVAKLDLNTFLQTHLYLWVLDSHGGPDIAECVSTSAHSIVSQALGQIATDFQCFNSKEMTAGFSYEDADRDPLPRAYLKKQSLPGKFLAKLLNVRGR